ncbi:MAG: thioredoxin [Oscillospiraceae bacterium]|nr:thioredoxin [Oscillospiraceae bacterium]
MSALHITKETFPKEVLQSEKTVLLDFFATWCGPCKMLAPILDEIAEEREDIKVCKVDVDQEPELAAQYQVVSIPTLFVIEKGQVVNQSLGAKPKAKILEML